MIWDIAGTVYVIVGGSLAALVAAGIAGGAVFLRRYVKNGFAQGVIQRIGDTISEAVAMANQTLVREIKAAKDPRSDGGTSLTETERAQIFEAVLQELKDEYGGWDNLVRLLQRIGVGDPRKRLDRMIEAEVWRQKMLKP